MATVKVFVDYEVPEIKYLQIQHYIEEEMKDNPQYNLDASLNGATYSVERGEHTCVCYPRSPIAECRLMAGIVAILNGEEDD